MLTRYTAKKEKTKLEILSVIISFKKGILAQIIVVKKPATMPDMTPLRVVLGHHNVIIKAGPKAEPNPLHA